MISIIIPALNEEKRIVKTVETIRNFFKRKGFKIEIIIVDDGSTDKTREKVKILRKNSRNIKIISHPKNLGKGAAVKTGVLAAKGDFILFTDADLSVPIRYFDEFWKYILLEYDIVCASRGKKGARILKSQGFPRELLGKTFGIFTKLLVLRGISDPQCGFKLFNGRIGKQAFKRVKTKSVLFDIEFLILSKRRGAKIKEVPVLWKHNPDTRLKYNFVKSIKIFWELLKIKRRLKILLPVKISN